MSSPRFVTPRVEPPWLAVSACVASLVLIGACSTAEPPSAGAPIPFERCTAVVPGTVRVADLLEDVVDLERACRPDPTPYVRHLASSTNVASSPTDSSSWYGDAAGFVRIDGAERVMLESAVPGAITRLWTANPNGRLRVYVDGSSVPTLDVDMLELFSQATVFPAPFTYRSAKGWNLVFPISWSDSIRVTTTASSLYYTIDYREYAPEVVVESYPAADAPELACAIEHAREGLRVGLADPAPTATFVLASDDPSRVADLAANLGGSVVRGLRLRLGSRARDVLELTAFVVEVDGERVIEAPLATLLAPTSDSAVVSSLPISSSSDEWTMRWPMPFASSMRVALESRGGARLTATLELAVAPMEVTDDTYRLNARYVGVGVYDASMYPAFPRVADIDGEGRFVGLVYEVGNADPTAQWWGEGDPIMTVDGRPAMRGTGTEDHFLYGFCSTERFASPFSGQTRANASDNGGIVTVYRFHTHDDVPFTSSFVFDFELLSWGTHNGASVVDPVASLAWFYARKGTVFVGASGGEGVYTPISLPEGYVKTGTGWVSCGG